MTVLSPAELAAIKARAEAAPGGPWFAGGKPYTYKHEVIIAPDLPFVELTGDARGRAAAAFIAHARTDIPALLAHADALEEQGSKLTREMDLKVDEIERLTRENADLRRRLLLKTERGSGLPAEAINGWTAVADDPSAEAGIAAEDNLPGLTPAERDDFMGGAA